MDFKQALVAEAEKNEALAKEYAARAAKVRALLMDYNAGPEAGTDASKPVLSALTQLDAIVEIFGEKGRKMHKRALFSELSARGVKVKNIASLGVTLSSNGDKFKSLGNGEWELKQ